MGCLKKEDEMEEFLKWYFNLSMGGTVLFFIQAIMLMLLVSIPIVVLAYTMRHSEKTKSEIKPTLQSNRETIKGA